MFTHLSDLAKASIFFGIVFTLVLGLTFAPLDGQTMLVTAMFTPTLTVLLMLLFVTRDGFSRDGWASLGLHRAGIKLLPLAFLGPLVVLALTYYLVWSVGIATVTPPAGLDTLGWVTALAQGMVPNLLLGIALALGEELGWRNYLLPKLAASVGSVRGMALTGLLHGVFHLPLIVLAWLLARRNRQSSRAQSAIRYLQMASTRTRTFFGRAALACGWVILAIAIGGALPARAQTSSVDAHFPRQTETALQRIVDKHLAVSGAPGILVGIWTPDAAWIHAQGLADVTQGTPIGAADTVRIASVTKTFVATVVLQLVDEGQLGLDDPVEAYLPDLLDGQHATIRQLLGMRSGIFNVLDDVDFAGAYDSDPLMAFTPAEAVALALRHPAEFPPGQRFRYSDTNYLLLGLLVEEVTGLPVGEAIQERILVPLHLTSTSFPMTPSMPERHASGYSSRTPGSTLLDVTTANEATPALRLLMLLPFVWLACEGAKKRSPVSSTRIDRALQVSRGQPRQGIV